MKKPKTHSRWFDKTKQPPAWLVFDTREIAKHSNGQARHRMDYYRRIWNQTPPWATEEGVKAIYSEAHRRRQAGEDVQVDHIIPLKGALVSGLHCEQNLRIITRKHNAFLSNTRYPGCPQEELPLDVSHEMFALERMQSSLPPPNAPRSPSTTTKVPTLWGDYGLFGVSQCLPLEQKKEMQLRELPLPA